MYRPRRAPIWIAALAVLVHLFAMPLGAGARDMGMAGHCPVAEAGQHDTHHAMAHERHAEHGPDSAPPTHHVGMPCCCAAGSAVLAAIPASTPELHAPPRRQLNGLPDSTASTLSPRLRWPSLNPRASPRS